MKKCIVIGGGFAGLTSAAYLANSGQKVELIEASPKLGGRAYSFIDDESSSVIDNGQHILMGCYKETLKFLKLIGAEKNFSFQERLRINFLNDKRKHFRLEATRLFYPLNLLLGLLNFEALNFIDRLRLLKFFIRLYFYSDEDLKRMSVHQWLMLERQNEDIIKTFWDFLAIGALNTSTSKASAKVFADVLKQIFFTGNKSAAIVLPSKGLSESYCMEAQTFMENNGGVINFSEQVLELEFENNRVTKIITSIRTITDFDFVISSIPWFVFNKLQSSEVDSLYSSGKPRRMLPDINFDFEHSSILSLHIWLHKNYLTEEFYGLISSPVQWVFNHGDHVTIVISDANDIIEKTKEELFEMVTFELQKYLGIEKEKIKSYKVIKEKRATFIPDNQTIDQRPKTKTVYKNFFLAGDWVDTGLPSTIESAVKSGRMAAELVDQFVEK